MKRFISHPTLIARLAARVGQIAWRVALVVALLLPLWLPAGPATAAQTNPAEAAQALLDNMTAAERVGQLFLVTFPGSTPRPGDPIVDLILNYHVGGVVLQAANDNIAGTGDTPTQLAELTNQLQRLALQGAAALITDTLESDAALPTPLPPPDGTRLPLLIAVQQDGDGAPNDQILRGLTTVPSAMAIGATWQPENAAAVGAILGQELTSVGINMLLGPSLDVLNNPTPGSGNNLGVNSFGGSAYWVGLMGQAYTSGLHSGSGGRLAVVAKHFPGAGNSDRPLGEEVATVRRSLSQLLEVELAPFAAITGGATNELATADALLTTHIRYQGFQDDIQTATAPISFDPQALLTLMNLPAFSPWRQAGGLIVSDSLGAPAVQRYYDATGTEFPHRRVAKDALLAGNDLLYLADFALEPADYATQLANIRDTITWFQEKYVTDPSFEARVDEAVLRILQLKLRQYQADWGLENVLVAPAGVAEQLGRSDARIFTVAENAISLIATSTTDLQGRLPSPPAPGDRIVIFTDVRQTRQCSSCPPLPLISPTSLEERMLALYGPSGSNQIQSNRIRSYTFADLAEFLQTEAIATPTPFPPTPTATPGASITPTLASPATPIPPTATPTTVESVAQSLDTANWVIFAMLDIDPAVPASRALQQFLAQRPDLARNKRVIVFAYNAPYFLDTTEVSKLTAYFAVYSKIESSVDASVRALFQESPLAGAPPVNVPSIDYELAQVTRPEPTQIIDLMINQDEPTQAPAGESPLEVVVGDTLQLRTGLIIDHNGNPVPDGTMVQFMQQDRLQGFVSFIGERPTVSGVAELDYVLEARTGQFRITATAGEARNSTQVDIIIGDNVRVVVVTLTPAPTPTATATPSPSATATLTPTATPSPTPTPIPLPPEPGIEISLTDFRMLLSFSTGLLLVIGAGLLTGRVYGFTTLKPRLRLLLWGVLGGLIAYNYYALNFPGSSWLGGLGLWAGLLTTTLGGLLSLFIAGRQSR
ncbi:MAG: hypothetical protein H6666_09155 [Ardenticatenaceae bacterium]|nr:hypothetical protein [Ardenticatenaceae bacterium]